MVENMYFCSSEEVDDPFTDTYATIQTIIQGTTRSYAGNLKSETKDLSNYFSAKRMLFTTPLNSIVRRKC